MEKEIAKLLLSFSVDTKKLQAKLLTISGHLASLAECLQEIEDAESEDILVDGECWSIRQKQNHNI